MSLEADLESERTRAGPEHLGSLAAAVEHLNRTALTARGKQVGDRAPDFALRRQSGELVTLSSLLHQGPVVLSFFRGEWCPFCRAELNALLAAQSTIAQLGATLLMVSPEPPSERLAASVATEPGRVFVLQDPMHGVALQYGLVYLVPRTLKQFLLSRNFDLSAASSAGSWLLPIPADFVIDQDGLIALSYVDPDYTRRLDPESIVETLRRRPIPSL